MTGSFNLSHVGSTALKLAEGAGSIQFRLSVLPDQSQRANILSKGSHLEGVVMENRSLLLLLSISLTLVSGSTFFQTDFEQVGGHIEIASDQPVFSFALFGDYSGRFLSAIEGRSTRPGR